MKPVQIIFPVLLITMKLSAQQFFGGATGGIVGSQVAGDQLSGFNKAGICAGFFAGIHWSENITTRLEMLYFQKGSRQNARPDRGIYRTYIMRLNYLEVPLMITFHHLSYFEIETGLSFGYLPRNKDVEYDEYGVMPGQKPFKKFELSFNAALNYPLNNKWKIHFRYNNSLLPIREHPGGVYLYWWDRGQYNIAVFLGMQYQIL